MEDSIDHSLTLALNRAAEFERALVDCFSGWSLPSSPTVGRPELCLTTLQLSQEHSTALKLNLSENLPNSAAAMLRLQFESLIRAAWIRYCASDEQVAVMLQPISESAEKKANKLPPPQMMLKSMRGEAPVGLLQPLDDLCTAIKDPLNSFVHSGLHPIRRSMTGFPLNLQLLLVRQSNELMHHAFRLTAVLRGSQKVMDEVTLLHIEFKDCLM